MKKPDCLRCSKYIRCVEKLKAPNYSCSNFARLEEISSILDLGKLRMTPDEVEIEDEDDFDPQPTKSLGKGVKEIMLGGVNKPQTNEKPAKQKKLKSDLIILPDDIDDLPEDMPDDFVWKAMKDAFDPHTHTIRDLKIDDRDLPLSLNYFHFSTEVAGNAIKVPFARQLWVCIKLLGEYCPHCSNPHYLDVFNVPVDMDAHELANDHFQMLENGVCPKCGATKSSMVLNGELTDYIQLVLVAGQRAGKSSITSTLAAYQLHRYLKAPKLSTVCRGIQDFTPLTFTFCALTATKAIKLLWNPFDEIVKNSSWYSDYFRMLDHYGNQYGKEFYKHSGLYLKFFHKNIDVMSMGPNKRSLRGDTRLMTCFTGDTKVLTNEGWKLIGEDLRGLKVDVNGKYHKITNWMSQGEKLVWQMTLRNGLSVKATPDHKFRVFDQSTGQLSWKELRGLTLTDLIVCEDPNFTLQGVRLAGGVRVLSTLESRCKLEGTQEVFDITVSSKEHAFSANGILAANCTDELGLFPFKAMDTKDEDGLEEEDERERANGDEVHQSLDNSLATIRVELQSLYKKGINTIPTGLNVNISSPFSWKDKIMRLLGESENPEALSLGVRLPTWDVNPLFQRDHPIIRAAYAKNARRAERDYGANPPQMTSSIFQKEKILSMFSGKQHHTIAYDHSNPARTAGKIVTLIQRKRWKPTILAIDAGLSNNSFALVLGAASGTNVEVYSVMELIPQPGTQIDYRSTYDDIILPVIKACNVVTFGYDRFNSVNLSQQVVDDTKGKCLAMQVSLNSKQCQSFISMVGTESISLPELELPPERIEVVRNYKTELLGKPVDHLFLQFLTVRELQGVLVKGDGYTDDVFRALVLLATIAFMDKFKKHSEKYSVQEREGVSERSTVLIGGRTPGMFGGSFG